MYRYAYTQATFPHSFEKSNCNTSGNAGTFGMYTYTYTQTTYPHSFEKSTCNTSGNTGTFGPPY